MNIISQAVAKLWDLTANALRVKTVNDSGTGNVQVNDADVSAANPIPVDIKNASIEVDLQVSDIVSVEQTTHDKLNSNANIQQGDADIASGNPLYTQAEDSKIATLGSKADNRSAFTDTTSVSAMQVLKQLSYMLQNPAIHPIMEKPFKATAYFSRPGNTDAYVANDAITNSTSAPAVLDIDLSSQISAGDYLMITNCRVSGSSKLTGPAVNVWVMPATFAATNDNAELSIDDASMQADGICIPCYNLATTALNTRMFADGIYMLKTTTTHIYVTLQALTGFTPGNADRYDVILEGVILR